MMNRIEKDEKEGSDIDYAEKYRDGYDRGVAARKSKLYSSWNECHDETTFSELQGFIDGFENNPKLFSWRIKGRKRSLSRK